MNDWHLLSLVVATYLTPKCYRLNLIACKYSFSDFMLDKDM